MKMFATERRKAIMNLLHNKKRLTVKELAKEIDVSEATLRADLNKMELDGLLIRTHGGAILKEEDENNTSFSVRAQKNREEKNKIAQEAIRYVEEKQCILLDASSTALELARLLKNSTLRLTVVTTGVLTALELKDNTNLTVILVGGVLTNKSTSIEGTLGLDILNHVNIDLMFTSGNGFSFENGLTDFNFYEVELKKQLVKQARKLIALVDSSKIEVNSSSAFAKINQIDILITDESLSKQLTEKFSQSNIQLIIAN